MLLKQHMNWSNSILTVSPGEQWIPAQHLGQYTTDRPDINRPGIFFEREHDFWRTIPSTPPNSQRRNRRHEAQSTLLPHSNTNSLNRIDIEETGEKALKLRPQEPFGDGQKGRRGGVEGRQTSSRELETLPCSDVFGHESIAVIRNVWRWLS